MQVAIENLNINLNQGHQSPIARAFIEALLRTPDAPSEESEHEQTDSTKSLITPPAIGDYWVGQGGVYAGVARGRDGESDYRTASGLS